MGDGGVPLRQIEEREIDPDGVLGPAESGGGGQRLELRGEGMRRNDVAARSTQGEPDPQDVMEVAALAGLAQSGLGLGGDLVGANPVASVELQLREDGKEPRQAHPVTHRARSFDQRLQAAAAVADPPLQREDPGELQVRVLERRHLGDPYVERIGALHEATPRPPEGMRPGRRVTEHSEFQGGVAARVGQIERRERMEPGCTPVAPREVPDPRQQGVDLDAMWVVQCGHRHRLAEERIRGVDVAEQECEIAPVSEDRPPQRAVGHGRRDRGVPFVGQLDVAGRDKLFGGDRAATDQFVESVGRCQPRGLLEQFRRRVRRATPGRHHRPGFDPTSDGVVRLDAGAGEVTGALLRLGHDLGEPFVDVLQDVLWRATIGRRGQQRVGEPDPAIADLEDAGREATLESPPRPPNPDRGLEDRHGGLGQGSGMQRHIAGCRLERRDALPDQFVEAARHRQGVHRRR